MRAYSFVTFVAFALFSVALAEDLLSSESPPIVSEYHGFNFNRVTQQGIQGKLVLKFKL